MKKASCPTCGKSIESGTLFCPHCGAAIFESELTAEQPTPQPAAQPTEQSPAQPAEQPAENPEASLPFSRKLPMQKILPVAAVVAAAVIAVALSWDNLTGLFHPSDTTPQLSTGPSTQTTASSTNLTLPSGGSGYIPDGFISSATIPSGWTFPSDFPPFTITIATVPAPTETEPAPTETEPAPVYPDLSWVVTTSSKMSYEEFFAEDRPISGQTNNTSWTADDGNTYTINSLLQIFRDGEMIYTVPHADQLSENRKLITADGTYVYIANEYNLYQIELLTGATKNSFSLAKPFFAYALGPDLIYFTGSSPDYMLICRFYVPTQTLDILYQIDDAATPDTWFSLSFAHPYSSLGDVTWTMMNPEMHFFLYKEMQNPDSKYRTVKQINYSKYWEDPRLLNNLSYSMDGVELMRAVYEDTGIQPLLKGIYHGIDGSYTEDLGIVDECWFGSGQPHDHWNPEKTEFIAPTVYTETPTPLSGLTAPDPEMAEQMRSETWSDGNDIFRIDWNRVKNQEGTVVGPPVARNGSLCNTKFYSYYISDSGSIIRLSLDGTATEIYTAQNGTLKCLSYEKGILVFIDGDTAMALDMVYCTARRLVSHPGLNYVEWDLDDNSKIYFETILGMQGNTYLLDPATGKLRTAGYRL